MVFAKPSLKIILAVFVRFLFNLSFYIASSHRVITNLAARK